MRSNLVVLKAGGSSVGDPRRLAGWLKEAYGGPFLLVVSAAPGRTDELIRRAAEFGPSFAPPSRDALLATGEFESAAVVAAALTSVGLRAVPIPPTEVFETDSRFGDAEIRSVYTTRVLAALRRNAVPVIGGFVGRGPDGLVRTLGRGGSDYSAVALAAELGTAVHLLKADVDGVYPADPHADRSAERFDRLGFDQAVALARSGAKVIQLKAAELARTCRVPVWVRQTGTDGPGTWIGAPDNAWTHELPSSCPYPTGVSPLPQDVGYLRVGGL
jgi:aspartate kinase